MLKETTLYVLSGLLVSSTLVGKPVDFGEGRHEPSERSALTTATVAENSAKPAAARPRTSRDNRKPAADRPRTSRDDRRLGDQEIK